MNDELWSRLSSSLAIFVSEDSAEVFVLPNDLTNQHQVARYFDLGQLVRTVTAPQQAYALTLSSNGWHLWGATATTRAAKLELAGSHPTDAADATHRESVRGPQPSNRSTGDEARKQLLETYAKRVAEAVDSELGRLDPQGRGAAVPVRHRPAARISTGRSTSGGRSFPFRVVRTSSRTSRSTRRSGTG